MSSNLVAVRAVQICKRYEIYETPRDRLKQFVMPRLRRLIGKPPKQYFRSFSALDDVSFEIMKGETIGIIGRNGAGKSTLLQILCGTLTPSSGSVEINGRVAALLELGAGFNAEFTGRENVYMNASVLGLSKEEIDSRFDDIVAFADIGDFLDQPVKTYSSGMYVRLAFAVVVHVDADILIVDEALSVGDMYFQSKCMVKMKELMASGIAVLFVSHDIGAVKALCQKALYLEKGKIIAAGASDDVVEAYYTEGVKKTLSRLAPQEAESALTNLVCEDDLKEQQAFQIRAAYHRVQNGMAELLNVRFLDAKGRQVEIIDFGQTAILSMVFKSNVALASVGLGYHVRDRNGFDLIYSDTAIERVHITNLQAGEVVTINWEFTVHLREDHYSIAVMLSIPQDLTIAKVEVCDFVPLAVNFQVSRGQHMPIHGATYWPNKVSQHRLSTFESGKS